jgi:uncharacterized coiled-coil DUF342 family protein
MPEQSEHYQDIFITELKKDLDVTRHYANIYKRQLSESIVLIDKLKKENGQLKKTLNRYRVMVLKNSLNKSNAGPSPSDLLDEGIQTGIK